jgi:plastocyanin
MNRLRYAAVALVVLALIGFVFFPAGRTEAGPDKIAFPTNYQSGVLYTIADRNDLKEYREMWTSSEAIEAARADKPLPYGTVITHVAYKAVTDSNGTPITDNKGRFIKGDLLFYFVMEKRAGWGAEYPDDLRNGEWEFAMFKPDRTFNEKANINACMQCHKPHEQLDFVKSYRAMGGKRVATNPKPVPPGAVVGTILGYAVSPPRLTVEAGKPVSWVNIDDALHQLAVEGTNLKTDYLLKGESGTLVFNEPGVYDYRDTLHPNVTSLMGTIEVRK